MIVITALAIALSGYVSDNAMHRKKADFDPQGAKTPKPILIKLGRVDYVWDHHMTILVGVALRGWSGYIRDLSISEFLFFLFFLFFFY